MLQEVSPRCVWGAAGKIHKTSVLIGEVGKWGTQEEKCINLCFSPDLCYLPVGLRDLFTFEAWNLFFKQRVYSSPLLVAAGGSAGVTSHF